MFKQRALFLLFTLCLLLNGCGSGSGSGSGPGPADQSERVQTKVVVAPDG